MTLYDYTGQYRQYRQDYTGLYMIMQDYTGLYRTIWNKKDYTELCTTISYQLSSEVKGCLATLYPLKS